MRFYRDGVCSIKRCLIGTILLFVVYFVFMFCSYDIQVSRPSKEIEIHNNGINLYADVYEDEPEAEKKAVVIALHSSNVLGRKMPFMQVISQLLSYSVPVINADLRGFGDSSLVGNVDSVDQLDFSSDIDAWVKYAKQEYGVGDNGIFLLGRATGASAIIYYMHVFPFRKHHFILVCPPRGAKVNEEVMQRKNPFLKRRWESDMHGKWSIKLDVLRKISHFLRPLSLPDIQNGRSIVFFDTPKTMDTEYLRDIFERLSPPKRLYIAADYIDHYYGTHNCVNALLGVLRITKLNIYDRQRLNAIYQPLLSIIVPGEFQALQGRLP